ncbi:MAG: hypothetical protein KDA96_18365, partial [Planctomycetaceae bacterium]|nr:hypothetical protein [Planctomycetaceae bacterium]
MIDCIRQFGWNDAFRWPQQFADFDLNADQVLWVLQEHERTDGGAPSDSLRANLRLMLANASFSSLEPHLELLESHRAMQRLSLRRSPAEILAKRRELREVDASSCWEMLLEDWRKNSHLESFGEAGIPHCELLIERIAEDAGGLEEEVLQILRDAPAEPNDESAWLVGCMIILAGHMKLDAAIPAIVSRFRHDWDWFNEEIQYSLIRIGTSEVIRFIGEHYREQPDHARLYLTDVLKDVHQANSVDVVSTLLDSETDDFRRVELGAAAVAHFDSRGLDVGRQVYLEYRGMRESEAIIEHIVAMVRLADLDVPDVDEWEARVNSIWDN